MRKGKSWETGNYYLKFVNGEQKLTQIKAEFSKVSDFFSCI